MGLCRRVLGSLASNVKYDRGHILNSVLGCAIGQNGGCRFSSSFSEITDPQYIRDFAIIGETGLLPAASSNHCSRHEHEPSRRFCGILA